jgi:FKBP-type peptidyl-prolyl cis-trans isomerase
MLKNQKWTIAIVVGAVFIVGASAYFGWKIIAKDDATVAANTEVAGAMSLNPNAAQSETISLQPKPAEPKDPNALSVNDSSNTSANLGSGSRQQVSTSSSNASSASQDFSQFEQYKDKNEVYFGEIVTGTGAEAVKDKQLAVTYKGYLTNGQVFDQSRVNNGQLQPLLFTLGAGQLIPGFEQGVAGMKVGGTRRVIIPPSLGYGDKSQGGIPANSVLVFDITLVTAQ